MLGGPLWVQLVSASVENKFSVWRVLLCHLLARSCAAQKILVSVGSVQRVKFCGVGILIFYYYVVGTVYHGPLATTVPQYTFGVYGVYTLPPPTYPKNFRLFLNW